MKARFQRRLEHATLQRLTGIAVCLSLLWMLAQLRIDILTRAVSAEIIDVFLKPDSLIGKVATSNVSHMTCRHVIAANGVYSRLCHFRSICWDRNDQTFVYYDDPSRLPLIYTSTGNGSVWTISPHFVKTAKDGNTACGDQGCFLPLRQTAGPIPEDHVFANEAVHVYFQSFYAENFGHALGDDILPIYALQVIFGLLTQDIRLMTPRDYAETSGEPGTVYRNRGRRVLADMTHLISNHAIAELSNDEPYRPVNASAQKLVPARYTCFRSLLAGHADLGMALDRDRFFSSFSDYLLERAVERFPQVHAAASLRLRRQRVLIIKKTGRRAVLNVDELAAHVRKTFRVQVDVVDPAVITLSEQITACLSSTLIVTPEGGISFISAFVRAHTPIIFVGHWSLLKSTSEHIERHEWQHVRRFNDLYYDVQLSDITIMPPGNPQQPSAEDYMHYGAVTVDLSRMSRILASGLLIAERELNLDAPSYDTSKLHEFADRSRRL